LLESFTCETFAPLTGDVFRLDAGGDGLDLELTEATEAPAPGQRPGGRRAPFSVVFAGPLEPVLPQRIYPLAHPALGSFELFLVPIGPEEGRMRYEAVFT
jgi:hypothetical protein